MLAIWYNSFTYSAALLLKVCELCGELHQFYDVSVMTEQYSVWRDSWQHVISEGKSKKQDLPHPH